jgi:hypothetical protein
LKFDGFNDVQIELKDIRQHLNALETSVANVAGFAKEIDHLLQRAGATTP